ncbi:MAG: ankyrin repeat domain-containing protein [Verrucomicrobia bacterium]|nr:ankyrin repeat domain-containing protein [Verrucomicrobiota bacterium]
MGTNKVSNQEITFEIGSLSLLSAKKQSSVAIEASSPQKSTSSRSLLRKARYETQLLKVDVNRLFETDQNAIRERLKELGFDVLIINNNGDTVLHQACRKQNIEAVELALRYGFNPNQTNKAGDTALHIAAEKGNIEICQKLIDAGADIFAKNLLNQAPVHKALAHGQSLLIGFFEQKGYKLEDAFHAYLIAEGLNPEHVDNSGNTFIHRIVASGNLMLMKEVIKNNYHLEQLEAQNKRGETPLAIAIKTKNQEMVKLLLEHRRSSSIPAFELTMAAKQGWSQGLELLLNASPDWAVNELFHTESGNLQLIHYACFSGDLKTVQLLIDRGADINFATQSQYEQTIFRPIPNSWFEFTMPCWGPPIQPQVQREGGFTHAVMSPLSIAKYFHPENKELQAYLISKDAREFIRYPRKGTLEALFSKLPANSISSDSNKIPATIEYLMDGIAVITVGNHKMFYRNRELFKKVTLPMDGEAVPLTTTNFYAFKHAVPEQNLNGLQTDPSKIDMNLAMFSMDVPDGVMIGSVDYYLKRARAGLGIIGKNTVTYGNGLVIESNAMGRQSVIKDGVAIAQSGALCYKTIDGKRYLVYLYRDGTEVYEDGSSQFIKWGTPKNGFYY